MKHLLSRALVAAVLGSCALGVMEAQNPSTQGNSSGTSAAQPAAPNADPYLNNAAAGTTTFPLAAPAGADSKAATTAPTGAANQGTFNPSTWKYGPAFNAPPNSKIWNPVKLKMQQGGKVTGGTVFGATDPRDTDDTHMFLLAERCRLTSGSAWYEKINSLGDLPFHECAKRRLIHRTRRRERCDQCRSAPAQWFRHRIAHSATPISSRTTSSIVNQPRRDGNQRAARSAPSAKTRRSRASCVSVTCSKAASKISECWPGT